MDIIKFINSKDIAEYLRKIKYGFSPEEAMYLIHADRNNSLSKKHAAYKELISLFPDHRLKARTRGVFKGQTLASFLTEYMARENALLQELMRDGDDAVYGLDLCFLDDKDEPIWDCRSYCCLFHSYNECREKFAVAFEDVEDYPEIIRIRICKRYFLSRRTIELTAFSNWSPIRIDVKDDEHDEQFLHAFDLMWIDIPTPFRFGDVLCVKDDGYFQRENAVFVLADLCTWGGKKFAEMGFVDDKSALTFGKYKRDFAAADETVKHLEEHGDKSDMVASGYVFSERGLGYEHFFPYLDFEFYRGKFDEKLSPLKALSAFLKGEISDMTFVNAMRAHDARRHLKESEWTLACFSPDMLQKTGLNDSEED